MSNSFHPGQHVGDYEVVGTLGVGGLGTVYEVRHVISRRSEAMKVLLLEKLGTPELNERFRREIQMLAALNHPHIAALHNAFYHGDQLVMIMELVRGETLRQRNARAQLNLPSLVTIATETLSALGYAHRSGIIHRDIKPSNIMVAADDAVKVLDFGIALGEQSADLTAAGTLIGSLHYMSPEQVAGERATPQSDIYSFGVTLYELVTGHLPFNEGSNYELMTAHIKHVPRAPIEINPALPLALSNAIITSLAKRQEDRFSSAQQFADALQASLFADAHTVTLPMPLAGTTPRSGSGSAPHSAGATPSPSSSASLEASPHLHSISRELAAYIGPIAKVVVKRLATHCVDTEQLYAEAAREISDSSARQRFLQNRRRP